MRALLTAFIVIGVSGCVDHIAPYKPKRRRFADGDYGAAPRAAAGSLYAPGANGLFEDDRAARIGDVVIVRIDENEAATRRATTKLSRSNERSSSVSGLLGKIASAKGADPSDLLGVTSDSDFTGSGSIERRGRLSAVLPTRVRKIMPNGDLFVEGTKVIKVGAEEHHLYVSGIVRRRDIAPDGTVASSRMAAAEIEYVGRGDINDQQRKGWFSRLVDKLWPF